nr:protein-serine/threonine phosphatase [Streptococcus vestibularis]
QAAPVEADLGVQQLDPGAYILANSDGLTNMISIEQSIHIVNSPGFVEENTSRLVAAANEAGRYDNITVARIKGESEE